MQLNFGSVRDPRAAEQWTRLLDVVRDAVAVITPKELAYRLDIQPSYLSEALAGQNRKGLRLEWLQPILNMAPEPARVGIGTELFAPLGYELVRRQQLTPEEKLRQLEQRVAMEFGSAGARLVEENRR